ncbi:MAG: nickel-dependent hydrogenase large subunit, partial [Anaerolineae bacterium]|nr:nickel-dependent hydrogenase large subunit [Anaerolineae bacterium]
MTTLTFPLSRIEGHARVVVDVRDGIVQSAKFQATEFRGFEYLVKGAPAEQMPVIVPRICGVCSTAHHVASVKALEDAYGVTPPPLALTIRELLMLGQLLQNQATSLFIFTMPDRLGVDSIFDVGEIVMDGDALAGVAARALQVRQAGTHLISLAGGQFIHPVKAVIGGVTGGISVEAASAMQAELVDVLPVACALFDTYWSYSVALSERLGTWGDDAPACYLTAVSGTQPNYYGDFLRLMGCEGGEVCAQFAARDYRAFLTVEDAEYSYA